MVVAIHQPEHLPWLGFFDKLRQADVFVLLDDVQFRKNYFQNRNRILGANGPQWVTVPVLKGPGLQQPLDEVRIDRVGDDRWRRKCWQSLVTCYGGAPHFDEHAAFFEGLYERVWDRLVDLNIAIIDYLVHALGLDARLVRASALQLTGDRAVRLLRIAQAVGADTYLSGVSGREYLDTGTFRNAGIAVAFQEFHHPIYAQRREPFVPCMSAVDALFDCGPRTRHLLEGSDVPRIETVFE